MADITIFNAGYNIDGLNSAPIGPLLIVSVLENAGFDVDFEDYQVHPISVAAFPNPKTFRDFIECDSPIIGITVICGNLPTVLGAVQLLKQDHPEKIVILGGPSATDSPDYILRHFAVDVIVRGEGEHTAVELMRALESGADLKEIQGISYRQNGKIHHNPARPRIQDLDSVPFPAYDRINFDQYLRLAQIATARGCPYECSFCSVHSIWQRKVTCRSPENVAAEIASIQDRIDYIDFLDDTLVLNPRRVRALIQAMQEAGINKPWRCYGRINLMTPELLRDMAEGGCEDIFYGIESGSDRVLKRLDKKFAVQEAHAVMAQTLEYVPSVRASYIWGFPFETLNDFYDTLAAIAESSRVPRIRVLTWQLSPLVASPLYREFNHLLKFSPELNFGLGSVLPGSDMGEHDDLIDLIVRHPKLFASFYYYAHPEMKTKLDLMQKLGVGFPKTLQEQTLQKVPA